MAAALDGIKRLFSIQADFNLIDLRHLALGGRKDGWMLFLFILGCLAANPYVI